MFDELVLRRLSARSFPKLVFIGRMFGMLRALATRLIMVAVASTSFAGTLAAQDRPPAMEPPTDATIQFDTRHISKEGVAELYQMRLYVAAGGMRVRADGGPVPSDRGYMIFDGVNHRAFKVSDTERTYTELPFAGGLFRYDEGMKSVRKGTDMVAGVACTIWEMQGAQKTATKCITNDGVLLRVEGNGPEGHEMMTATLLSRARLTDDIFQPPVGYKKLLPTLKQQP